MKSGLVTVLAGAGAVVLATAALAAESHPGRESSGCARHVACGASPVEKVTGIAAYISFGAAGPAIEAFAGKVGRDPDAGPVDQDTLYQMGSTSKSFTVAVHPPTRSGGKALDQRHARQVAARVSGMEGRHHPPPPQHDERYSHLFRNRVDVPGVGERAEAGFHPQGAGGCRLSKRHQSTAGEQGLLSIRTPTTFSPA